MLINKLRRFEWVLNYQTIEYSFVLNSFLMNTLFNDEKMIKRGIPLIIFIEAVVILFIYIKINDIEIF